MARANGVVIIIVFIGFVQEGRAARSLEAVQDLLAPEAKVLRAGQRESIPAGEVVVGDVVLLEAGDRVPVDVRLVETNNLQAQEAALTGESTAVEKNSEPVDADAELGERTSMAFAGTVVTAGEGSGVSVAVGDGSEIGRISGMLADVEDIKTPLMQRLDSFAKVLSIAILGLAALTFAAGAIVWSRDWDQMFFAAVAIAVAAIPEGLPAVMTVTLALGVQRMAARSAIIRRLPAVETLGSVLGYPIEPASIPKNVDYYLARTSHGSTLSSVAHSWVLARSDRPRSWRHFRRALDSDIEDVQGGTTPEGIHVGAMAGTIDLIQRCYIGVEMRAGTLHFDPALPEDLQQIKVRLRYRRQMLDLEVNHDSLRIASRSFTAVPIKVAYRGHFRDVAPGDVCEFQLIKSAERDRDENRSTHATEEN